MLHNLNAISNIVSRVGLQSFRFFAGMAVTVISRKLPFLYMQHFFFGTSISHGVLFFPFFLNVFSAFLMKFSLSKLFEIK